MLAGAETFVDIARFGEKKIDLLRRFRPFVHGTPAHDHLGDIFAVLDAAWCLVGWRQDYVNYAQKYIRDAGGGAAFHKLQLRKELREAEAAYSAAESRLIKARREYEEATREWRRFYDPQQDQS